MPGIRNNNLDYLSNIGGYDHGDNVPMNNVVKALVKLSDFLIDKAERNLRRKGNVASGATIDSMVAGPIQTQGKKMSIEISISSFAEALVVGLVFITIAIIHNRICKY